MVYASIEQGPVIGGKVKSFDASKAKGMPGVIDVVQVADGVAVVADSYWRAKKAREQLSVSWEEGAIAALEHEKIIAGTRAALDAVAPLEIAKPKGDGKAAMEGHGKGVTAGTD